jgi:RNA polymerase sigma factor (sigma-70 family)
VGSAKLAVNIRWDREPNHRARCNPLCPDRDVAFRPDLVSSAQPTESELIEAAQSGDKEAFAALAAPHAAVAFRVAYLITASAADAEDAAQEGLVKAWLALPRFRVGAPFRPWLLQIVVNESRNRRRQSGRQQRLALRMAQAPEETVPGSEGIALAGECRAGLLAAVETLRQDDQLVIAARYFAGLSEAETAAALSLRPGTVKSRLSRALARLREALGEAE